MTLTVAEREALEYLTRDGRVEFYSSGLEGLYVERWRRAEPGLSANQTRRSAWRRTSGSVMARLRKKGALHLIQSDGYTLRYRLTAAGREALDAR